MINNCTHQRSQNLQSPYRPGLVVVAAEVVHTVDLHVWPAAPDSLCKYDLSSYNECNITEKPSDCPHRIADTADIVRHNIIMYYDDYRIFRGFSDDEC